MDTNAALRSYNTDRRAWVQDEQPRAVPKAEPAVTEADRKRAAIMSAFALAHIRQLAAANRAKEARQRPASPAMALVVGLMLKEADAAGITLDEIMSRKRTYRIARPRQRVMHALVRTYGCNLTGTGKACGGYDHTTVMHAVKRVEHNWARYTRRRDPCGKRRAP